MRFVLILLIALAACSGSEESVVGPGPDRIVRLSDSEIRGLDPQTVSDLASLRVAADQYEGLTRFDAAGNAEAGLASRWSVADDGLSWRFELREGLRFSDGEPITASLFPGLLARLRDPATAAPTAALFAAIEAIDASDDTTVVIRLNRPAPALPALMAHPAMAAIPLHRIGAGSDWTAARPMVASGAYRLTEWRLNDRAMLRANPRWHGGAPPVATIVWRPMDDGLAALRSFLEGSADVTSDYPASRHGWLSAKRPDNLRSGPYLGTYYFAFNTREPPFDDPRVRRALSMAVERTWIARDMIGVGNRPAWGILPPGLGVAVHRPDWADWSRARRLEAAQALLAEAGHDAERPLSFDIRFNSSPEHRRVAVALAAMWAPLGVEAGLFNTEASLHFAALRAPDFTLARSGWIADLPIPENFLTVHTAANGDGNYSGYASPAYERTLARALDEPDPDRRARLMERADAIVSRDAPVLPLYYYTTRALVSERIGGWRENAANQHPSRTLSVRVPDRGERR